MLITTQHKFLLKIVAYQADSLRVFSKTIVWPMFCRLTISLPPRTLFQSLRMNEQWGKQVTQQQSMAEYCSFPIEGSTSYAATNNQFITTNRCTSLAYTQHPTHLTHFKYGIHLLGKAASQFVNGRNTHHALTCIVQRKNIGWRNVYYTHLKVSMNLLQ